MAESDLPGALDNGQKNPVVTPEEPTKPSDKTSGAQTPEEKEKEKQEALKKRVQEDYQLARALDLVRGVTLYEQRKQ